MDVCPPGNYSGREAHLILNRLAEEIHGAILEACGHHDRQQLVMLFYDLYDQACYEWAQRQHMATGDMSLIKKVEKAPSVFKYLLECAILSESCAENKQMERRDLLSFVLAAEIFFETCNYSDFLYQNDFRGGFKIAANGEISFTFDENILKSQEGLVKKLALLEEKANLDSIAIAEANFEEDISLKKDAAFYDPMFLATYGIKLSVIVDIVEKILLKICRKPHGVEEFSQNLLVKKIRRNTPYDRVTIEKALEFLKIDRSMLLDNWSYFKQRDMPISISRRPVVRLFTGKSDKGDVLYLGTFALAKSLGFLITDIDRGIIKLSNIAEEWAQEKGPQFETRIREVLSKFGFKVIRVTDPPPVIGEIDAVAIDKQEKTLIVVEAKAPKMDILMNRAKWHFERSRKWCQQLKKKMDWAVENTPLLANRVGSPSANIEVVIGVIVTRVPWYVEPNLPYRVMSFEEFESFIKSMNQ